MEAGSMTADVGHMAFAVAECFLDLEDAKRDILDPKAWSMNRL